MVEPGQLGGGVYATEQPDYLVLNNACGQLSLYASPDSERGPALRGRPPRMGGRPGLPLGGLRMPDRHRRRDPILPTDYLPRRLMGEYLVWFYDTLVADAPPNLEVVRHYAAAADISPEIGGREAVLLDNGDDAQRRPCGADLGTHLQRRDRSVTRPRSATCGPYPVEYFDDPAPARGARSRSPAWAWWASTS